MGLDDLRDLMYRKGFSRLLLIYSKKGNPSKILFLSPETKKFSILMELEIKSLILQLDKGIRSIVNELEIVYDGGDKEIYNNLNEFIGSHVYDPTRIEGVYARMILSSTDDGYTMLRVINGKGGEIYPRLIVKRIERNV
jgi:rRNA maturation protein Rpf1